VTKKLYVGNLDYATTEHTVSSLFEEVGEVVSVNLITDRMTGRSKGFAFVEMAESSTAQEAISQLDGKSVDGRSIKVDQARPKRQQESPWGGGGGHRRY
jgi:RNA recognition motif-containing protein